MKPEWSWKTGFTLHYTMSCVLENWAMSGWKELLSNVRSFSTVSPGDGQTILAWTLEDKQGKLVPFDCDSLCKAWVILEEESIPLAVQLDPRRGRGGRHRGQWRWQRRLRQARRHSPARQRVCALSWGQWGVPEGSWVLIWFLKCHSICGAQHGERGTMEGTVTVPLKRDGDTIWRRIKGGESKLL